jgi:hypothetical protein
MDTDQMMASFDTHYFPCFSDGQSNTHALHHVFMDAPLAKTWLFVLHIGLGVPSMESMLWLSEMFFLNNPDISL